MERLLREQQDDLRLHCAVVLRSRCISYLLISSLISHSAVVEGQQHSQEILDCRMLLYL